MEFIDYLRLLRRKKQTIVSGVVIFVVFTAIFTFVQPLKFGAESRVLVVQTNAIGIDSYAAARTNEYLGSILSKVVSSNTFFNEVINSGYKVDKDYFDGDTRKKMKKWRKTVSARSLNETGLIEVTVFHSDRYQVEQIARAVNYILKTKHGLYHGSNENIELKIIDQPIVSSFPVKPNIFLNFPLALVLSLIVSLIYIYSFPAPVYDIRLFPKRNKKNKTEEAVAVQEKPMESVGELLESRGQYIVNNNGKSLGGDLSARKHGSQHYSQHSHGNSQRNRNSSKYKNNNINKHNKNNNGNNNRNKNHIQNNEPNLSANIVDDNQVEKKGNINNIF